MRRDRRPLPIQLREEILAIIEQDGLGPGDRLPSEVAIANRFGVGRTTAREALKFLEQDGTVHVRHGSGRYVSQVATLDGPITRLESVTEMMHSLGYSVVNQVVSVGVGRPRAEEAASLGLSEADSVVRLERVRRHGDEPLIYSMDVIPRDLIPGPVDDVDWSGSLLELLEAGGTRVTSAIAQLCVELLPEAGQQAIGKRTSEPWILLVHRNLDVDGHVVIFSHDYHRYDRFTFNVFRQRA